ncbi:sensor histidine kinase [Variovorax saccharolyticus]|uniref:sensor histidine kinase n=1 Tax=Variovorax saccharolyticus TaxID=3053516 RepID=UPI0025768D0F|nr:ATP-binding protein [Variovorax sp. J31P216]MDM0029523.1 ATP-binding protein [Variovorax sp. J31P216]
MSGPSLLRRLLSWLVLLHLLAICLAIGISYVNFGRQLDAFNAEHMRRLAEAYVDSQTISLSDHQLDAQDVFERGTPVVQIWDSRGHLLASSWRQLSLPLQPMQGWQDVQTGESTKDAWRVYTASAGTDTPAVQIAQSEEFLLRVVARRAIGAALPVALMLPATLSLLLMAVWSTSRSLRQVAREVAAQDERSVSAMPQGRVPAEIATLVGAFSGLVSRLQQALSAQQRFAQDAAHELRSPITAIGLQLENLRDHIPAGEASHRFRRLEAGVARARHLIEQLLRMSTALQDDKAPHGMVDLASLLRESVAQHLPQADRRRIDLGLECCGSVLVAAPTVELHSIFDNLIDNALRYSREGGVVDVRLRHLGGTFVVEVVDDGPGMTETSLARAFDRFFRAPGAPSEGSGLGLAIARAAAERHGLHLGLQNRCDVEPGRDGLIARVDLPRASGSPKTNGGLTRS